MVEDTHGKRGITFGAFDLLHAGHVIFLRQCREALGENGEMTVGLHIDPTINRPSKNKPVQGVLERFIQLGHLVTVDNIMPYETEKDLDYILRAFRFDYRFLGTDYRSAYINGQVHSQKTCKEVGTEIVFFDRFHDFSSTELRRRISLSEEKDERF